ncbi:MAG: peptidyl-prolyl cis-trans isomerase [Candidatus Omnitrophica bacterium]|nr:peptidyl-prolyl cis-trans isomerase [Candidatus Omnitrophota bacterium]
MILGKFFVLIVGFIVVISFVGCEQPRPRSRTRAQITQESPEAEAMPAVQGTMIAKVNNLVVTLEEMDDEIKIVNSSLTAMGRDGEKLDTRDKKIEYLKKVMVPRLLYYQASLDRGLDRSEEVQKELRRYRVELLGTEFLRGELEKIEVDQKALEDYYNQNKEQFRTPEERSIREIVVSTEQEARDIMIQLLQGMDFATVAREKSRAASNVNGGDLGFIRFGERDIGFDSVAFSETLEVGKTSNIFKVPEGYGILKLEGKREGRQMRLEELTAEQKQRFTEFLLNQEQTKRLEELNARFTRDYKIEYYEGEIR